MGRPIGSGAGLATKPSKPLMALMVAELTLGPVQALTWSAWRARMASEVREMVENILLGWFLGVVR